MRIIIFSLLLSSSVRSLKFSMRRFLTGPNDVNQPNKVARLEPPNDVTATAVVIIPSALQSFSMIVNPTVLNHADLQHASLAQVNQWVSYEGIMYKLRSDVLSSNAEMIAFDMDGTLIKTKSGKTFAVDENDWTLWDPSVRTILQRLHAENKYLAIISNQSGIKASKIPRASLQSKVDKIIEAIGVPMDFICAIEDDRFRKPRPGMWEFLTYARRAMASRNLGSNSDSNYDHADSTASILDPSVVPFFTPSTYVGDAAGRPKEGSRNKDFADSDYKVALNLGVQVR